MFSANEGQVFSSLWEYWQSIHQGPDVGRLSRLARRPGSMPRSSGLPRSAAARLLDSDYLEDPASEQFGPVDGVDARDYRLALPDQVHRFDHVVWHRAPGN